jgi:hypothetical protein
VEPKLYEGKAEVATVVVLAGALGWQREQQDLEQFLFMNLGFLVHSPFAAQAAHLPWSAAVTS